jgi:hypothetical protein
MKSFITTVISCALPLRFSREIRREQVSQGECEDIQPGKSSLAWGSAFNPNGVAGTAYAGEQDVNSKNPKSVSQYDVACFQQESRIANLLSRILGTGGY